MTRFRTFLTILCLTLIVFAQPLQAKKRPVYAKHAMVVTTDRIATEIGVEILKSGGNAVDAAVAVGFALAVAHPSAGNIGGGGFMVIHLADGTATTIDYREKAPLAAHLEMYLDEQGNLIKGLNHDSYLAIGVPGTVAGLTTALEKFGTLSLKKVMQPAINLAEKGVPVSYPLNQDLIRLKEEFAPYPSSMKLFFPDGEPLQWGEILQSDDLVATLKRIVRNGPDGFYDGKTAALIAEDMADHGGVITQEDLRKYRPVIREPIRTNYRGYEIISMAPPSSGGVTLGIMLNILEGFDLKQAGHNSAAYIHLLAEAMRRAYTDRARHLGDPDFNSDMPVEKLISKTYAGQLRETIDTTRAGQSRPDDIEWREESSETTHFSIVDAAGNAVSNTYTLEAEYGSKIVANGLGFLYNNEMGDFNAWPGHTDTTGLIGTPPNRIAPEKRMLSSMTPTIVAKDGKPFLILGCNGGRRIICSVLQVILNVIDFDMNPLQAVDAPRFYHVWLPDAIRLEQWGFSPDTIRLLLQMGHTVEQWVPRKESKVMAILIDPGTGIRIGAADPRSPNRAAIGY